MANMTGVQRFVCLVLVMGDAVLLLRKNRPEWQIGKMNFFGGKVEPGETLNDAAEREAEEELGPNFAREIREWRYVVAEDGPGYTCTFFFGRVDPTAVGITPSQNDVGEVFEWHPISSLPRNIIGNCRWVLPLCLDPRTGVRAEISVSGDIVAKSTWGASGDHHGGTP